VVNDEFVNTSAVASVIITPGAVYNVCPEAAVQVTNPPKQDAAQYCVVQLLYVALDDGVGVGVKLGDAVGVGAITQGALYVTVKSPDTIEYAFN
jgi:hypothetical protein